jgi:threonine dehydrogenase-like Zn-dependent dehydrogenase
MRAAVMTDWILTVEDVPDPVPRAGQVLARVLACGICGSDLHLLKHGAEQTRLRDELAADAPHDPLAPIPFEASQPLVMGHEFCCEIVEVGPGTERGRIGDVVVSMPSTTAACTPSVTRTCCPAATAS